ncbi:CU044_5270 family protein, partial [Catellatospora sp. NPDC049609]|uniref:CU044_5270 family protein n=1 Tax=Catellatospora sp. NPDC049609 TaxID=3155505 RepID=UPI0034233BDA
AAQAGVAVLVAAALTVAGGAGVAAWPRGAAPPRPPVEAGPVLAPVAYQYPDDAPEAGTRLRALAGRITAADHDGESGKYGYHRVKSWGAVRQTSPEGLEMSYVLDEQSWVAADGSGRLHTVQLPPEFPSARSREYWLPKLAEQTAAGSADTVDDLGPGLAGPAGPPPTGPALRERLHRGGRAADPLRAVMDLFGGHVLPLAHRAEILRELAAVPAVSWRGEVRDRAGRNGVAVTADDPQHRIQLLLVFDPQTGDLLAYEHLDLARGEVLAYLLFLDYGRTEQLG